MGALADGALSAGGEIIGVMPAHLVEREVAHRGSRASTSSRRCTSGRRGSPRWPTGSSRCPGGLGTLEEFTEIWTWGQLGLHRKPYGLLDVSGY